MLSATSLIIIPYLHKNVKKSLIECLILLNKNNVTLIILLC